MDPAQLDGIDWQAATRSIALLRRSVAELELELRLSNDKYDRLLENLKDEFLFFCHDAAGRFTYVSPSITHILGYTPEEYLHTNYAGWWTPNPLNAQADLHTKLSIQGIKQPAYEMEVYHKNGSYRRFITIETPILDAQGRVAAVEGTARDITEKKKIEEKLERYREHLEELVNHRTRELRTSQKQLIDIIDFLPTPTYVVNLDGVVIAWNRAMTEMFGIEQQAAVGRDYRECMRAYLDGQAMIDEILAGPKSQIETGGTKPTRFDERFLPKLNNGQGAHVWIAAAPILDSSNQIAGAIESYRDVTQIKQAEIQIRESERRLSTLMSNLPGMAYRLVNDGTWKVEFVSSGCQAMLGYGSSYFIGRPIEELRSVFHAEDLERVRERLQQAIRERQSLQNEYRIVTASGEIKWVFDRGEVLFDENAEVAAVEGFISDFTFFKEMERRLRSENLLLRSSMRDRYKFDNIIGTCEAMQRVYDLIMRAATTQDSVCIYGESGTGKELVAQAIHNASERRNHKFVAVNCGAIPENLVESEFFGVARGAFTGATTDKKGYLETADGGTLFLDEIGEISPGFQVKLLRAIEGGGFAPVGGRELLKPNLRIVAASNKDLVELVRNGKIRNDFFFRIHVIPINLPPLRERGEDLLLLIDHFLKTYSKADRLQSLSREELEMLRSHDWPGNVRELQNVLRRYVTFRSLLFTPGANRPAAKSATVTAEPEPLGQSLKEAVDRFEKGYIFEVLRQNRWHKSRSAQELGVSRKTLFRKMQAYGLL